LGNDKFPAELTKEKYEDEKFLKELHRIIMEVTNIDIFSFLKINVFLIDSYY